MWILIWMRRVFLQEKSPLQTSQERVLLLSKWVLIWAVNVDFRAKLFSHTEQENGLSPVWMRICRTKSDGFLNFFLAVNKSVHCNRFNRNVYVLERFVALGTLFHGLVGFVDRACDKISLVRAFGKTGWILILAIQISCKKKWVLFIYFIKINKNKIKK